jgi:hypothetical protein
VRRVPKTYSQGFGIEIKGFCEEILIRFFPNGDPLRVVHLFVEKGKIKFPAISGSKREKSAQFNFF